MMPFLHHFRCALFLRQYVIREKYRTDLNFIDFEFSCSFYIKPMKILHVCLGNFFIDNYSYQENLLTKWHKKLGHDVYILASLVSFDKDGRSCLLNGERSYINENGCYVQRVDYKRGVFYKLNQRFRRYTSTLEIIGKIEPDFIFIHNLQFWDILKIIKYKKTHPNIKICVDNHADFSNSARSFLSRWVLHGIVWKYCARRIEPCVDKFFGVLPARCDFLQNVYGIPKEKIELLVMGADNEFVRYDQREQIKAEIRRKYNIAENEFLIVSGGKLDKWKNIPILEKAVKQIANVKILIFGNITPDMEEETRTLADGNKVQLIGWINSKEAYTYFLAADLVVFPGRHSVFWEQVVACGIPCVFKFWDGTTHVDIGGNCIFLYEDSVDEIQQVIENLMEDKVKYNKMKESATSPKRETFLYSKIAKQALLEN